MFRKSASILGFSRSKVGIGSNHAVLEGQNCLDDTGNTGAALKMTNVGFHRSSDTNHVRELGRWARGWRMSGERTGTADLQGLYMSGRPARLLRLQLDHPAAFLAFVLLVLARAMTSQNQKESVLPVPWASKYRVWSIVRPALA